MMVDKELLIAEIKWFDKLDIKYILEELEDSYNISYESDETIVLRSETVRIILQALRFLIEFDDEFAQRF